jgi:Poly(A) polymerase catalytic subunit
MDEKLLKDAQNRVDFEQANDPDVRKILRHVKDFIKRSRVLCYGGTAINNLLPKSDRFYDPNYDVPDYDFYTETPQEHAMKLADEFYKMGYTAVEVKPGVHLMTYKVFVNFMGIADITYLHPPIFNKLWDENLQVGGVHYVTPNFLRMSMYLELSRPRGDVSRWKKVYERLILVNKHYPVGCKPSEEERETTPDVLTPAERSTIEDVLESGNAVLLGMRAFEVHSGKSKSKSNAGWNTPIDLLAEPSMSKSIVAKIVLAFKDRVKVADKPAYAELLPRHFDIIDIESGELVCRVFDAFACHSYHELPKSKIRIGSIPTLLQFYLGFFYGDDHYLESYDPGRIVCIAQRMIDIAHSEGKRRFKLLTPLDCLGHQKTLRDIKKQTGDLREKTSKNSLGFLKFFFTYKPGMLTRTQKKTMRSNLRRSMRAARNNDDLIDLVADKTE